MQSISRDLLEPGMTLAADVLNPRGQVLIPGGTPLETKHLRGLKAWGVKSVNVTDATVPENLIAKEAVKPLSPEETDALISDFLHLNQAHLNHPFMASVVDICKERLTKRGRLVSADTADNDADCGEKGVPPSGNADEPIKRPSITVEALIDMTTSIATLPNIYFELKNVMGRASSASEDMANAIRNDPGLTARILKIVNSAYYSFPTKIETVPRAITIIGTDELTALVTATSIVNCFGSGLDKLIDMKTFWQHSICCGVIARLIGKIRLEQNVERFFVMGLLHDIGKLPMFSSLPKVARAALVRARHRKIPLHVAESEVVGFNHAAAGACLARSWRMSAGQQDAIAYHHRPDFSQRYPLEAAITHIAEILAHAVCIGVEPHPHLPPLVPEAWNRLGLTPDVLPAIMKDAEEKVSELIGIFLSENSDD